jgi:hypothetical protein
MDSFLFRVYARADTPIRVGMEDLLKSLQYFFAGFFPR